MLLPHQDLVDQSMPFNSTHPTRGGTNAGTVKICPIGQTHAPNFLQSELTGVSRSLKKIMFTLVVRKQPEESRELITVGDIKSVQRLRMEGNACIFITISSQEHCS